MRLKRGLYFLRSWGYNTMSVYEKTDHVLRAERPRQEPPQPQPGPIPDTQEPKRREERHVPPQPVQIPNPHPPEPLED